jgi:hypothetical protein
MKKAIGRYTKPETRENRVSEQQRPLQKLMIIELPAQSFLFWPVGSGDSTTISVGNGVIIQVDIRHLTAADDNDDPRMAVIDHLEKFSQR